MPRCSPTTLISPEWEGSSGSRWTPLPSRSRCDLWLRRACPMVRPPRPPRGPSCCPNETDARGEPRCLSSVLPWTSDRRLHSRSSNGFSRTDRQLASPALRQRRGLRVSRPPSSLDLVKGHRPLEAVRQPSQVLLIGRDHRRTTPGCSDEHVRVDNIRGSCAPKELSYFVHLFRCERNDLASSQESSELDLSARAADLGDHRCSGHGEDTELEPGAVVGPHHSVIAICGDQ